MQVLRPYQSEAVDTIFTALRGPYNRVLYTMATGCGKTTTFAEITARVLSDGGKVLILAHRTELITQAYKRVKEHCGLEEWEIGTEIAMLRATLQNRVIVGSVQTCMKEGRPVAGWNPDVIITDEGHHAAAKKSYGNIYNRYGVFDGRCKHVGCTATAKRTDRLSLYAENLDGTPVMLERKGKPPRQASEKDSVFERHVYDYGVLPAVEDGWLVPLKGHTVETETDINAVKMGMDGDFQKGELAKAVDNNVRTVLAINAWKQIAAERQTLVFCASVEHAHHAADLWVQAGYTAKAIDGETDSLERAIAFREFHKGELQVLCNMGIATEGTDLPTCSCIVHLRPTKSWNLYVQMSGRATRPLPGILDALQDAEPELRVEAIANSKKPDAYIIDLVDLYDKCGDLCSVPSILDLPVKLDLEGHSLTEAKKLLDEFDEVKERVIGECPMTFTELEVRLHQVNIMRNSGARTVQDWKATDQGYRFDRVPPGYKADLIQTDEEWILRVIAAGGHTLLSKSVPNTHNMKSYLNSAAGAAQRAIDAHRATIPAQSRGTLQRLTGKQINVLLRNGHSRQEIDCMPYAKAKGTIDKVMREYHARLEGGIL